MTKILKHTSSRPWFDKRGTGAEGVHKLVTLAEFNGCNYKVVAILSESGRPSWADDPLNETGQVSERFMSNPRVLAMVGYSEPTPDELATLTTGKQFFILWVFGYGEADGTGELHAQAWYAEDNGFTPEMQEQIDALAIGECASFGDMGDIANVTRIL